MNKFRELGATEHLLKALKDKKIEEPTEIQTKAIPLAVAGKDIIAGSATGSGKTLAFASSIVKNCRKGSGIQALIITPTRELCVQVSDALKDFSKYKKLAIVDVYGGVSLERQVVKLRRAEAVVATPGRLLDHIKRNTIDLTKIKILVIDEADRMFDMGFIDDVKKIIRKCPQKRQTLLFSATITREVSFISRKYMRNPVKVSAKSYVDPRKLKQIYYNINEKIKISLLAHFLKKEHPGLVMVFCNTKKNVDFVTNNLKNQGIKAQAIHGGFAQGKRSLTLRFFHEERIKVLVCTDVAARGLDIKGVSHVYNYDIPRESKQYIHRIGRTARAGKKGKAINLLSKQQHPDFTRLLKFYNVDIEKQETPKFEIIKLVFPKKRTQRFQKRPQRFQRKPRRRKRWVGRR